MESLIELFLVVHIVFKFRFIFIQIVRFNWQFRVWVDKVHRIRCRTATTDIHQTVSILRMFTDQHTFTNSDSHFILVGSTTQLMQTSLMANLKSDQNIMVQSLDPTILSNSSGMSRPQSTGSYYQAESVSTPRSSPQSMMMMTSGQFNGKSIKRLVSICIYQYILSRSNVVKQSSKR